MTDEIGINDYQRLKNTSADLYYYKKLLDERTIERDRAITIVEEVVGEIASAKEEVNALVLKLGLGGAK